MCSRWGSCCGIGEPTWTAGLNNKSRTDYKEYVLELIRINAHPSDINWVLLFKDLLREKGPRMTAYRLGKAVLMLHNDLMKTHGKDYIHLAELKMAYDVLLELGNVLPESR
jgi:hypothetical protein